MKFHNILASDKLKTFKGVSKRKYKHKNYDFIDKKQVYLSFPIFIEEVSRDIEIFLFIFGGYKDG
jgi:hypothetical protein